uniref:Uncharacterized protein n=1 Tax=Anopheles atroparvus TaxID=41427 RepID=A0A182IYM3_ANOAO
MLSPSDGTGEGALMSGEGIGLGRLVNDCACSSTVSSSRRDFCSSFRIPTKLSYCANCSSSSPSTSSTRLRSLPLIELMTNSTSTCGFLLSPLNVWSVSLWCFTQSRMIATRSRSRFSNAATSNSLEPPLPDVPLLLLRPVTVVVVVVVFVDISS